MSMVSIPSPHRRSGASCAPGSRVVCLQRPSRCAAVSSPVRRERSDPGCLAYIVALYARSLEDRKYDVKEHPPFADYVSGVLWEAEQFRWGQRFPIYPDELPKLKKRFPPRELKGMESGLCWLPPKRKKQAKKRGRLNQARYDELKRQQLKHAKSINTQSNAHYSN